MLYWLLTCCKRSDEIHTLSNTALAPHAQTRTVGAVVVDVVAVVTRAVVVILLVVEVVEVVLLVVVVLLEMRAGEVCGSWN